MILKVFQFNLKDKKVKLQNKDKGDITITIPYLVPFISFILSLIYLSASFYFKKIRIISLYSVGFATVNILIDIFLLNYTENNLINATDLDILSIVQLVLAIVSIFLPVLYFIKKKS
jgi:hypothetical protein